MSLQQAISYKDPSGFVVKSKEGYYRVIAHSYSKEFDHLMASGLYEALVAEHLLIPHYEVPLAGDETAYYKKIFPDQISFISYPFEWCYAQWQQVIINYLRINEIALQHGMLLKDASVYNFTFHNNACVLIDTISFDFFKEGDPWIAYRQFCEELLSPFLLMHYKDPFWMKLTRASITGLPLSFVSEQLPFSTRFNAVCLMHVHLHSSFKNNPAKQAPTPSGFSKEKLEFLFASIKSQVKKWDKPLKKNSIWDNYYENDIESKVYLEDKDNVVKQWLQELQPGTTIDVGANTGMFSIIAAQFSQKVYALESDIFCVDELYKTVKLLAASNITTVYADIVDPSPGLGWGNNEKTPLLERLKGDTLMALAVIHHLCLTRNIPLPFVASLFAQITSRNAIVEFVPKTDSKSQILLKNKGDIFESYTEEDHVASFNVHFNLKRMHAFADSGRKLYLWEKK